MFQQLSDRLQATLKKLKGQARLTEDNIQSTLREVRIALLEADVALPVVRDFIARVREKAVGEDVSRSLTPGQVLIRIVNDELVRVMGETNDSLNLATRPPAVILLAGLQGAGKTTTAAKLGVHLAVKKKKSVMLASADVFRPAAIDQLARLAADNELEFYPDSRGRQPVEIAGAALEMARRRNLDVLIIDTAGRLHVDQHLMSEIQSIAAAVDPVETLFVVDSMSGQDAVNSARAFNDALELTGVILTKTDGDARGGAALSIREVSGKPIKFLGTGEAAGALEPFYPDRVASRILGMGDIVSLVEEVEEKVDRDKAEKVARKLVKGKGFDLDDFRDQLKQMESMGGLASMLDKLPGAGNIPAAARSQLDGSQTRRIVAIIDSMTPGERKFPALIKGSRKKRIASGSGTQIQDVNRLLKQFTQMQKMMKKVGRKGNLARMMGSMKGQMPGLHM